MIYTFVIETAAGVERRVKACARPRDAYAAAQRMARDGVISILVCRGRTELFRVDEADGTNPAGNG